MNLEEMDLRRSLEKIINNSSKVFIVGHNEPDFDAIASAIGLQVLATKMHKDAFIVIDEEDLEPGVKKIINEFHNTYNIINKNRFLKKIDDNSSLITTDVNKGYMICLEEYLNIFKNILVIDHHKEDNNTIKTKYKFIDTSKSSASEIVANVLKNYNGQMIDKNLASFLLAGILLDTQRFRKATTVKTLNTAKFLVKKGANNDYIEDLFLREFESDKKLNDLIFSNTVFRTFASGILNKNVAFTLNREEPRTIYRKEELAKSADKILKYKVDASFTLGYIKDDLISISGRSKSDIDVADILSTIGGIQGGGTATSAGAKAKDIDPLLVEKLLIDRVTNYLTEKSNDEFTLKKTKKY